MPVNTDYVGHRYPPSGPYAVTAEQIAAFADAVRAESPLHRDEAAAREAGYPGVVAPPTFAVSLSQRCEAQLVRDEQAGIDFARVVHGEQSFTHHRPLVAGDEVVGVLHVDSIRAAGGHAMVTTRTELSTATGEPVCTATSTIVVRGEE